MEQIRLEQHGQWMPADIQTPISLYLGLVGQNQGILLESAQVDGRLGRYSIVAWNFAVRLTCRKGLLDVGVRDQRFEPLRELDGMPYVDGVREAMKNITIDAQDEFKDLPAITRGLVGYFGYGMAGMFEPKLSTVLPPKDAEACLVLPGNIALFDHVRSRLCMLTLSRGVRPSVDMKAVSRSAVNPEIGDVTVYPDHDQYTDSVRKTIELIREGECIQTVISTRFSAPFQGDAFVLYRRLRQVNPSPYLFFMRLPGIELFGSSPELLVGCREGELTTCPIAGTRRRGKNTAEDKALEQELLQDPKERAEHVMLVDLGRNDLGRIAKAGTVSVDQFMQVERFSHVMHLTSYVSAELREKLDGLDVLRSAFPAGTVSGAPKVRAMEIISELEPQKRGPYAGAIGWLGLGDGPINMDTGITIRSMWVREGRLNWQAGAGIVFDSDPEKEWEECANKARVLGEIVRGHGGGDVLAD
ncbi:anthranilate synthase component I family protein [Desulfobaculum bizertense]|uniref:Anthranilate synthase component 1 n=1 Tax=Desulfobaculum bizertense DSM 18034 TaxID=1121442 RepID=A0A1T4WT92_9BACT|nr:anthranilate synthase component I family protein [Desulfobaculum bizertense]UIJ37213.1 anthranilate synthase component I family protein [Desulfobaculum bizertense]SKA80556.1 anthranilate synthase component 1 [Desulfobaculum bizertense DSM 18034]